MQLREKKIWVIHITVSLNFSTELKPLTNGRWTAWLSNLYSREKVIVCILENYRSLLRDHLRPDQVLIWVLHTLWSLPTTLPLKHYYKIPHQILLGWDTVFEGSILLCPPIPGKSIKLFFYTSPKTSISEIWLGNSAQRLRVWHQNYSDCCFHSSVH